MSCMMNRKHNNKIGSGGDTALRVYICIMYYVLCIMIYEFVHAYHALCLKFRICGYLMSLISGAVP